MSISTTPEDDVSPVPARIQALCVQVLEGNELEWRTALVEIALLQGKITAEQLEMHCVVISPWEARAKQ